MYKNKIHLKILQKKKKILGKKLKLKTEAGAVDNNSIEEVKETEISSKFFHVYLKN